MRILTSVFLASLLAFPAFALANPGLELAAAAKSQIGVTVRTEGRYQRIAYPNGDVPQGAGISGDVIVRAYRKLGVDLQVLVIEDMHKGGYGKSRKGPDRNFDHRRANNLATFFKRQGATLPVTKDPTDYLPGDIVTYRLPGGLMHMAMISDQKSRSSVPLLVHNLRAGVREDNALFAFPITGHYRWRPPTRAPAP